MGTVNEATQDSAQSLLREHYAELRPRVVFFFRHNNCPDPENLADEVFARVHRRFSEGAELTATLPKYVFGVARNVLREHWSRPKEVPMPPEGMLTVRSAQVAKPVETALLIQQCLKNLKADQRSLLRRYFWEDPKSLARQLGLSDVGLRVRICRIIKEIRLQLQKT